MRFYLMIKCIFQICLEIKLNDHHCSENGCFSMTATLHNCLSIYASNNKVVLYLAMTQHYANKGAQQIAESPPPRAGTIQSDLTKIKSRSLESLMKWSSSQLPFKTTSKTEVSNEGKISSNINTNFG